MIYPHRVPIIKNTCKQCNNVFFTLPCRKRKFCSRKCWSDYFKKYIKGKGKIRKNCKICKKEFFTDYSSIKINKGKFCSHRCYWKSLKGKICKHLIKEKIKKVCEICRKEFLVIPSLSNRKVCSRKCAVALLIKNRFYLQSGFKKGQTAGDKNGHWKGGLPKCIECGKPLKNYNVLRHRECYYKSDKYKKENHYNWKGGISYEPYPTTFDQQLRDKIRARDNFKCQLCEIPELESIKRLHIHHIDHNKKNCDESNLIALCISCNSKVNFNQEKWEKFFQNKKEEQNARTL